MKVYSFVTHRSREIDGEVLLAILDPILNGYRPALDEKGRLIFTTLGRRETTTHDRLNDLRDLIARDLLKET